MLRLHPNGEVGRFLQVLSLIRFQTKIFPAPNTGNFQKKCKVSPQDLANGLAYWLTRCAGTPTPHSANSWLHSNGTLLQRCRNTYFLLTKVMTSAPCHHNFTLYSLIVLNRFAL